MLKAQVRDENESKKRNKKIVGKIYNGGAPAERSMNGAA